MTIGELRALPVGRGHIGELRYLPVGVAPTRGPGRGRVGLNFSIFYEFYMLLSKKCSFFKCNFSIYCLLRSMGFNCNRVKNEGL